MRRICLSACTAVASVLLAPSSHADVDFWPLVVISEEQTAVLYPLYVRERQSVEITQVGEDRIEILLGSEKDGRRETIERGGAFAGHSFDELASHGPGRIETPDFLMLFPWYYRTNHGRDQHALWPLFKTSEGELKRIAPLWFRGENSYTLFPILHRTPDSTLLLLPPLYIDHQGPTRAVFPLFLRTEHELYALPGYYRSRRPGQPAVDNLLFLYRRSRDDSASRVWALLGLYGRVRGPGEETKDWVFPFYGRSVNDSASSMWALLGLYGRVRGPKEETEDWVFPFFYEKRAEGTLRRGVLFPFYFQIREPERSATWVLPVWWERTPELSRTWVLPLWLSEREELAGGSETRTALSVFWPIFSREVIRAHDGKLLERHRRFLIFSDHRERDGGRSFRVLGIVISEQL